MEFHAQELRFIKKIEMGLRFKQDSHWSDKICAPGKWDLVKF